MSHIRDIKKSKSSNYSKDLDNKQSRERMENLAMAEQMANRLSEIKFLFETDAKEIEFEEMIECQSAMDSLTEFNVPEDDPIDVTGPQSLNTTASYQRSHHHRHHHHHDRNNFDFASMPPQIPGKHIPVTDLDDDNFDDGDGSGIGDISDIYPSTNYSTTTPKVMQKMHSFSSEEDVTITEPKKNFKRLAQNFKSRFKFKLSKSKKSKKCKLCSRKIRSIHTSASVADFDKEYHVKDILDNEDWCNCDAKFEPIDNSVDNGLTFNIKRHDSSGSSNVSKK